MITIIIPTIKHSHKKPAWPGEVIVVNGKEDGRGAAMDAGATQAQGEILLFLHDDTVLPDTAYADIEFAMSDPAVVGGAFTKVFAQDHWYLKFLSHVSNLRSKHRRIFYGDQAMFVRASVFEKFGGFEGMPLFEDVMLSKKLRAHGKLAYLSSSVITDGKKITEHPVRYTLMLNFIKLLYFIRVPSDRLYRIYYRKH